MLNLASVPITPYRWAFIAGLIILAGLSVREYTLMPDGALHLRFLSVGQGDSALITTPDGKTVVIDGGPDWSTLESLGKYLPFFDRSIDLLVLSHPNLDHLLSLPEIVKRYKVSGIVIAESSNTQPRYRKLLNLARAKSIPVLTVAAGQSIDLGNEAKMHILWPPKTMPKGFPKDENNRSIVAMLSYKNHRALFTGDEEFQVEETLVRAHADLKADILKVAHHGSRTSSSTGFLLAVRPSLAIISVGRNIYGHPRPEVVKRLKQASAEVWRTDERGMLEVVWK